MRTITINGDRAEIFIPVMKMDQRTGKWSGWASLEERDGHDEICDIEKSWPALVADANEMLEISDGRKTGVLRRQHDRQKSIGKETLIERRKQNGVEGVYVEGVCTDKQAIEDAATGVLTGLSIRGLVSKWPDENEKGLTRYAWKSREETSMVDRPAVPHALIEVMKSNGEVEMVKARGYEPPQGFLCRNQVFHARKAEAASCESDHTDEKAKADLPTRIAAKEQQKAMSDDSAASKKANRATKYASSPEDHAAAATAHKAAAKVSADSGNHAAAAQHQMMAAYHDDKASGKDTSKALDAAIRQMAESSTPSDARKSLYNVARVADLLSSLASVCESEEYEEMSETAMGTGGGGGAEKLQALADAKSALYDAMEAMVKDERGEDDDGVEEAAMSYSAAQEKVEALKDLMSLRVPKSNGSMGNKEDEMFTEQMKSQIIAEATSAFVGPVAKALGLTMASPQLTDVTKALEDRNVSTVEAMKAQGEKITALEAQLSSLVSVQLESSKALAQTLAVVHGVAVADPSSLTEVLKAIEDKPAAPRAAVRAVPVTKTEDDEAAKAAGNQKPRELTPLEALSPSNLQRLI